MQLVKYRHGGIKEKLKGSGEFQMNLLSTNSISIDLDNHSLPMSTAVCHFSRMSCIKEMCGNLRLEASSASYSGGDVEFVENERVKVANDRLGGKTVKKSQPSRADAVPRSVEIRYDTMILFF
jgi:hypothetical protein